MMDPLVEMHLLLREAGWVPEYDEENEHWMWSRVDVPKIEIQTYRNRAGETVCEEWRWNDEEDNVVHSTIEALRQRLQELTPKK